MPIVLHLSLVDHCFMKLHKNNLKDFLGSAVYDHPLAMETTIKIYGRNIEELCHVGSTYKTK